MKNSSSYFLVQIIILITANNFNFLFAQISPGDLTGAHEKLEGISNCTKCHVLGEKIHNSKCLDCHAEIKALIESGKGYHSDIGVKGKECSSCHSEHHGRNFKIINFNPKSFRHGTTGFELTGKHQQTDCNECHTAKFIQTKIKDRKDSYLGLETKCISCHHDNHRGTLGEQCNNCHNTVSFKIADKFNHDNAAFKLTGAHIFVSCIKCHPKETIGSNEFQKFRGIVFTNCIPCHNDVHNGKFGNDCKNCHDTGSFKRIIGDKFDHNNTNFPLIGMHKNVECNKCHKSGQAVGINIKHEKCIDCHEDYHQREFIEDGKIRDCSGCHKESGFKPSYFTIDDHARTNFKLTGSHLAVPCRSCHFKEDAWHFRITDQECSGCHENIHGKEIHSDKMTGGCAACHFTGSWEKIEYDHKITGFALSGKHSEINCRNCHLIKEDSKTVLRFASVDSKCEVCHKDIHFGQFKSEEETDCSRCHSFSNWQATEFNHDKTLFPLKGAHLKTTCSGCHKTIQIGELIYTNYKIKDFRCISCH